MLLLLASSFAASPSSTASFTTVWSRRRALSPSWDGVFYDPDELKITIHRTGSSIVAKSDDWDIAGELTSETKARLAGLEGTLEETGVSWSNGVVWSKKVSGAPLEPPTWPGAWHGKINDNDVSVWKTSPTRIVAEGYRNGKKWKAEGRVSGDVLLGAATRAGGGVLHKERLQLLLLDR